MAAQLTIKANVVNILEDLPKANDTFLVDTNIWFWMTYSKATIQTRLRQQLLLQLNRCQRNQFAFNLLSSFGVTLSPMRPNGMPPLLAL
jgi:hypothetical protein